MNNAHYARMMIASMLGAIANNFPVGNEVMITPTPHVPYFDASDLRSRPIGHSFRRSALSTQRKKKSNRLHISRRTKKRNR